MNARLEAVVRQVEKVIVGKRPVIEKILMALLSDGHVLLDDLPGVGKTTLAVALARSLGLAFQRVQFTPDVMPSDLVGFSMYHPGREEFIYRPGALSNAQLVLGDEINRASSKTQSALLEAMEERQATVDGKTYPLPSPFLVIATENSVGTAGTQPLPYAQLDRFLVRLRLGYPDRAAQLALLSDRLTGNPLDRVECVMDRDEVLTLQRETREVTVRDAVLDYISQLALCSREHAAVAVGISPRGALFLCRMAQARAYLDGRDYATGRDVRDVFQEVCAHRVLLREDAPETDVNQVLEDLLRKVDNPDRQGFPAIGRRKG